MPPGDVEGTAWAMANDFFPAALASWPQASAHASAQSHRLSNQTLLTKRGLTFSRGSLTLSIPQG